MSGRQRILVLRALLVTAAAAEAGRRILTPRAPVTAPVPVDIREHFSQAEIARGRGFSRPQRKLALGRSALAAAELVALVRRPPAALARRRGAGPARTGLTAAVLPIGLAVPGLPLRALARRRAIAAGLDTQSWSGWASDLAKAAAIEAGLGAALAAGLAALSARERERWWRAAALATVGLSTLVGGLAPVLLDPIFNDFDPLPAGETRTDVLSLAAAAGIDVGEVYAVDASRRTSAANAYVTGLGPTKRVVLYDTLLDRYERDEIRLVVAHELAHLRHRDVWRGVAYTAILAGPLCWATQQVAAALAGRAPHEPIDPAALPALALAAAIVSLPLGPSAAALSRAQERRADELSLRLAGAPEAFVAFERRASLQNLADLEPGRVARALASHPPVAERIGAALAFADDDRRSGGHPGKP
ncbi:MAG TPA: M48 family metalloprotease [Solirubrobacteraceae bacterium]|nr:M48 family metalloprotease [Solirubrobacteraceae bacterium]